jgi:polysaccharide biosynthesis protein PslG
MKRLIFIIVILVLTISCATVPDRSEYRIPDPESKNFSGLQFGLCHAGYSLSDEEYALLDDLGVQWIRIDFRWDKMEKVQGEWDFSFYDNFLEKADAEGRKVLAILDYDTSWLHVGKDKSRRISPDEMPLFLEYVKVVADRYGDRVGAFEIWNEPNTKRFWTGSDADFFDLTNQTLDLLKSENPQTPVAVGSIFYNPVVGARGYLKRMIASGVLEKADAISVHPYVLNPSVLESRIIDVRDLVASAGYSTPIWITEAGFPTGGSYPNKVREHNQGRTVAEALTGLSAAGVELITWYELFDRQNPEEVEKGMSSEAFFGLVWPDYRWKPGAYPYSVIANQLAGADFVPENYDFKGKRLFSLYQAQFLTSDGTRTIILRSTGRDIEIDLSDFDEALRIIDLLTGGSREISSENILTVGKDPIMLIFR